MPKLVLAVNVLSYAQSSHSGRGMARDSLGKEDAWEDNFQTLHMLVCCVVWHDEGSCREPATERMEPAEESPSWKSYARCFSLVYARCFLQVFLFLMLSCPKCELVWGNCCERLCVEIFVRVLRSSRVNFNNVNNTNVFSVSELKALLFCYCCGSQFCVTKAVLQV